MGSTETELTFFSDCHSSDLNRVFRADVIYFQLQYQAKGNLLVWLYLKVTSIPERGIWWNALHLRSEALQCEIGLMIDVLFRSLTIAGKEVIVNGILYEPGIENILDIHPPMALGL